MEKSGTKKVGTKVSKHFVQGSNDIAGKAGKTTKRKYRGEGVRQEKICVKFSKRK